MHATCSGSLRTSATCRSSTRSVGSERGVDVLHKAGWISDARHDTGLVFWKGGVFVAGVMTWRSSASRTSSDRLAGRVAALTLQRLRRTKG